MIHNKLASEIIKDRYTAKRIKLLWEHYKHNIELFAKNVGQVIKENKLSFSADKDWLLDFLKRITGEQWVVHHSDFVVAHKEKTMKVSKIAKEIILAVDIKEKYFEWADKYINDRAKARQKLVQLKQTIERNIAKAWAKERRGEYDGTMVERANERNAPLDLEARLIEHVLAAPTRVPPRELQQEFADHLQDLEEKSQYKKERQEKFQKFPNLVGKKVFWKHDNNIDVGIVVKQKPGKWGDEPIYSLDSSWRIPHRLIKKVVSPRSQDVLETHQKKEETFKNLRKNQVVEWNSRKLSEPKGKVISVGSAKVKVDVKGMTWFVPFRLITKIDGKKV